MFREMMDKLDRNYYTVPHLINNMDKIEDYEMDTIETYRDENEHVKLYDVRYNENGNWFVTAQNKGFLQIHDSESGDVQFSVKSKSDYNIVALQTFNKDSLDFIISANEGSELMLTNANAQTQLRYATEGRNEITSIAVNNGKDKMLTGGKDATIRLYDLVRGDVLTKYGRLKPPYCDATTLHNHSLRIMDILFKPDSDFIFISAGLDDVVKIWDIRNKHGVVREIVGPKIRGHTLIYNEPELITASFRINKGFQRWDFGTGKLIANVSIKNRSKYLTGSHFTAAKLLQPPPYLAGSELIVVGGLGRASIDIVNVMTDLRVAKIPLGQLARFIDTKDDRVVCASHGGKLHLIKIKWKRIGLRQCQV